MSGWIGVDLDGTVAYYDGWKSPSHIGDPIPRMAERVRQWLAKGQEVRIVTARAGVPELIAPVQAWCLKHFGVELPVTDRKDFRMIALYDDRAVQVEYNTGRIIKGERDD